MGFIRVHTGLYGIIVVKLFVRLWAFQGLTRVHAQVSLQFEVKRFRVGF